MSTTVNAGEQSTSEIRTYPCDFSPDLLGGVTVESAEATHIPLAGESAKTVTVQLSGNTVYATLPEPESAGRHIVSVLATLSNGDVSEMRLEITVKY